MTRVAASGSSASVRVHSTSARRAQRFGDREAISSREFEGASVRGVARSLVLSTLSTIEAMRGRVAEELARPRVQILLLHHLFDDEAPRFRALLKRLAQSHEFIGYSEAVERIATGRAQRPALAFTFDDGLASCGTAAEILREHGASACFFVIPSIVDERNRETVRRFCVERLQVPPVPFLGWDAIGQLVARGHEIGSHTWSHPDLGSLGENEVAQEIGRAHDELVRRLGVARHFAWPYGSIHRFSPFAARTAFDVGHVSVASAVRGCHLPCSNPSPSRRCLRRDNITGSTPWLQVRWFLARASREAAGAEPPRAGDWPPGWDTAIGG